MEILKNILLFVALPMALGLLVAWIVHRITNRKPQKEISFDIYSCQSYDNKKEGAVQLEVVCNGKKLDKSVVVLKGKLVNTGKNDIKYANIFEDDYITLSVGDSFECLDFNLISPDTDIKATVLVDNKVPKFKWSLMKKKESFDMQIIAKYQYDEDLSIDLRKLFCKSLKFDGRADGIDEIKIIRLEDLSKKMLKTAEEYLGKGFFLLFSGMALLSIALADKEIPLLIGSILFIGLGILLVIAAVKKISNIKRKKKYIQQNTLLEVTDTPSQKLNN